MISGVDLMKKEYKFILFLFVFIFFSLCLLPISGDDYSNYMLTHGDLFESVKQAIHYYFTWEGRFVSRLVLLVTTYHKLIYNVLAALAICCIFYFGVKLCGKIKSNGIYFFMLIAILLISPYMFAQCYA